VKSRNILSTIAAATAFALVFPAQGDAQVCAGYSAMPGAFSAGANLSSPPGGTAFGLEASANYSGPLASFASFNLVRPEGEGARESILGAGLAYEVTEFVPVIPTWLSVCPSAAVSISSIEGTTNFTVPLGVGFGTTLPLVAGIDLMPFVMPQFVITRVAIDDIAVRDHNFGIGFGALAGIGNVYAGVTAGKQFVDAAEDIDIALRAGLRFPLP
jgi:hypothetical protein